MKYQIYRLHFSAPVHFGQGSLDESNITFCADSFFSALCQESLFCGGETALHQLVTLAKEGKLLFSDLFPFVEEICWIPKPLIQVKREETGDSVLKKSFKKLTYIPLDQVGVYGKGDLDPREMNQKMKKIGKRQVQTRLNSRFPDETEGTKTLPYEVGLFRFGQGNGLYVIVGFSGLAERTVFENLLNALSFSGIGGKRSSGFGRFTWDSKKCPIPLGQEGEVYLSLSTSFPKDEELDQALDGANYKIQKRSGFISSPSFSDSPRKKKAFYTFQSGSTFLQKFEGDIFDLSNNNGTHPVYSYQKALFLGVKS